MKKNKIFIKINPIIDINNHPWADYDKDYWPNKFDCKPKDPKRQHVRPSQTTKERLEKLPIFFVTGSPTTSKRKLYGVDRTVYTSKGKKKVKKVPKEIKKTQQRFYSVIKKRPEVIGEIERKKPGVVLISSKTGEETKGYATSTDDDIEVAEKQKGRHFVAIKLSTERGVPYRRDAVDEGAGTAIHELEHVRQYESWKGKPKLHEKMSKGRYEKRRDEVLARQAEEKAEKKRYDYQSYPYEFSPKYEKTKERLKKEATPSEKQYYKRKQKKFFAGYRRMMDDEQKGGE